MSISRNSLETPSLNDVFLRNFTLSNSNILLEDLIRRNKGFEIFLIDCYYSKIGNENIDGKYQKILLKVLPTIY